MMAIKNNKKFRIVMKKNQSNPVELKINRLLKKSIKKYEPEIQELFNGNSGQFLLASTDKELLRRIGIDFKMYKKGYKIIWITSIKSANEVYGFSEESFKSVIFLIDIDMFSQSSASLKTTSILYYFIELPDKFDCFVCLLSNNCKCLENFEKRVKSRFHHKILAIEPLQVNEEFTTIENIKRVDFMEKYSLNNFSLDLVLSLFEPLHLFLLCLLLSNKIIKGTSTNLITSFKENQIKEFKNISNERVLAAYYDLVNFRLINESSNEILFDRNEFYIYVRASSPLYIKRFL